MLSDICGYKSFILQDITENDARGEFRSDIVSSYVEQSGFDTIAFCLQRMQQSMYWRKAVSLFWTVLWDAFMES